MANWVVSSDHTREIPPHRRVKAPQRIHIHRNVVDTVESEKSEHESEKRVEMCVHRCYVCPARLFIKIDSKEIKFRLYTDKYVSNTDTQFLCIK